MVFEINGVPVNKIHANTVKIHKRSNYQNDCSFMTRENENIYQAGMEVVITDGANKIFGGLIQQPKKIPLSKGQLNQSISSKGYKQLLTRRTASYDIEDEYAGDAVEALFDTYLADGTTYSEELTKGTISQGALILKDSGITSFYKLFSSLAKASGCRFWITDDKEFNFIDTPSYQNITKVITDDTSIVDAFKIMKPPTFKEDLTKYRNRQFAIGKDAYGSDIIGVAIDEAEETRMNEFFGSGVYGNQFSNDNMSTIEECNAAAAAELAAYSVVPSTVEVETTDFIDVNQFVRVKLDMYDLDADFVVDEVTIEYDKTPNMLVYKATLKRHIATAKQNSSWTDDWTDTLDQSAGTTNGTNTTTANKVIIQDEEPLNVPDKTVWIDSNDYSRHDVLTYDADATLDIEEGEMIFCSGTITLTLFTAVDNPGVVSIFKNTGTGVITIATNATETIDGASTYSLSSQYDKVKLVSDGTNWSVI